jgi:hypothetical protein
MKALRWLTIGLFAASVGCTEKGKPIHPHAPAKPQATQQNPLETPTVTLPSTEAVPELQKFAQSRDPLGQVVIPFAAKVLSKDRIQDPKSLVSRAVRDELLALNHMILNLTAADRGRREYLDLAYDYTEAVVTECGQYKNSCTGLRYFKLAANSSQVVKQLSKASVNHRIRLLLIALELKNRNWDGDLVDLLLTTTTKNLSLTETADLERAQQLLAAAFTDAAARIRDREEARRFLDSMKGWSILADSKIHLQDGARMALFELAAKADYLRDTSGKLNPGLKPILDAMEANPGSVFAKQKLLKTQKLFVPAAAGARDIPQYDELLFLLDGIYLGQLQPQAANVLYRTLNRTSAQLREAVENYVRIHFLAATYESTKTAGQIFNATVEAESLLWHAIREADPIRRSWQALISQSGPLKSFAALASAGGDPDDQSKLKSIFDSLPRTITRSAEYPHMLVLFYMLSKKRFDIVLPRGGHTLNTSKIMTWFFDGKIPGLFSYTEPEAQLNYFDIAHSFDLAVRTGIFETIKVDTDDFITETLRRLTDQKVGYIDYIMDQIRNRPSETLKMRDFKRICAEFKGGAKFPREIDFTELNHSIYFGDLRWKMFEGMAAKSTDSNHSAIERGAYPRNTLGLFYSDGAYNDALEVARLELGSALRIGQAMVASYRDFLIRFKLPQNGVTGAAAEKEADRLTENSRAALDALQAKRKSTLEYAGQLYQEIGSCYLQAALLDRDLMDTVMGYEKVYLRHVHSLITQLRSGRLDEAGRANLQKQIQLSGLPGGFTGLDRLNESGYHVHKFDLMVRLSKYLMYGLNVGGQRLPPIAPHLRISYGERLDLDGPVIHGTGQGYMTFVENSEDFIATALKIYFKSTGAFLTWKSLGSHPVTTSPDLMKSVISLYRLDFELNGRSHVITPAGALKEFEKLIEYMRLTTQDREIMSAAGIHDKFAKLFFHKIFIRAEEPGWTRTQDTFGIYDYPLLLASAEQLGSVFDMARWGERLPDAPVRQTVFYGGQNYYNSRNPIVRGNPAIPYNGVLDKQFDKTFGDFVRIELRAIRTFQDEAKAYIDEKAKLPADQRPRVDLDMKSSIRDPLLSPGAIDDFRIQEKNFRRQTDGLYH